jgi:hypothetical protein
MIFIYFTTIDTQGLIPNDIFHKSSSRKGIFVELAINIITNPAEKK